MAVDKTKDIAVGGTLHSIATGNIIAHADEIKDDSLNKKQSEINAEVNTKLSNLTIGVGNGITRNDLAAEYHLMGLDEDDNTVIDGQAIIAGIKTGAIIPDGNNVNIGASGQKFNTAYVNTVEATTVNGSTVKGNSVVSNNIKVASDTGTRTIGESTHPFVDGYITNLHSTKINNIAVTDIQTKSNSYSKTETNAAIKVVSDKVTTNTNSINSINTTLTGSYYTKSQTDTQIANKIKEVVGTAPEALDTLGEIAEALSGNDSAIEAINGVLEGKANSSDVYTKQQIDDKVTTINGDISNVSSDVSELTTSVTNNTTEIQNLDRNKADKTTTYTKTQVDNAIQDAVDAAVADLAGDIYYFHASLTASANKTLIEKGVNTDVVLTVKSSLKDAYAKEITCSPSVTLTGTNNAQKTATVSISDTTTYTFTGTFDHNVSKTAKVTITAKYPIYSFGSTKTTLASADVTGGTKKIANSPSGNYNITLSANATYFWICVPNDMSVNKVTLSGFNVPMEAPVNVNVTGKGTYKCYRSTNTNDAGTYTLSVS